MSEWETFCDVCYYDLWRVRRKDERGFNDGFHLQHGEEAKELVELLNKLERGEANTKLQEVSSKLADALRQRDKAMKLFESGKRACASLNEALDKTLHELREAREQNAKLRDIAQKAIELAVQYYDGPCERDAAKLRAELDKLKEGEK